MEALTILAQEAPKADAFAYGLSAFGAAVSIGYIVGETVKSMARQPETAGMLRTTMFIGLAFVEALALIGFVVYILSSQG